MMTARASPDFLELFEDFDAAGIGQAHVEQHEIGRLVVGHAQRSRAVVSLQDVITPLFALLSQRPTNQLLVVDDQNLFAGMHFYLALGYYRKQRKRLLSHQRGRQAARVKRPIAAQTKTIRRRQNNLVQSNGPPDNQVLALAHPVVGGGGSCGETYLRWCMSPAFRRIDGRD